jgi:Carbohydrate binding domain (family 11)
MNIFLSRKPEAMHSPLVALTLIAFTAANVVSGADAKSPDQGEPAASLPPSAPASAKRVVVWDGEQASRGNGWVNPKTSSIGPQTIEAHSGNTAVEFKFKGDGDWLGGGWNWCAFQTGPYGTDIRGMKKFTFWIKSKGKVADLQINLLCNGPVFDMPEHHTEKVSVLAYCPQLSDGQWHQVSVPLTDLKQPKGFDPLHVGELQMFNAGAGDGSYFFDDLAFE